MRINDSVRKTSGLTIMLVSVTKGRKGMDANLPYISHHFYHLPSCSHLHAATVMRGLSYIHYNNIVGGVCYNNNA